MLATFISKQSILFLESKSNSLLLKNTYASDHIQFYRISTIQIRFREILALFYMNQNLQKYTTTILVSDCLPQHLKTVYFSENNYAHWKKGILHW